MNTLRKTCAAIILSLTLAVPAFAGQIDSPGKSDQPPPPPTTTSTSTSITTTLVLTIISLIPIP